MKLFILLYTKSPLLNGKAITIKVYLVKVMLTGPLNVAPANMPESIFRDSNTLEEDMVGVNTDVVGTKGMGTSWTNGNDVVVGAKGTGTSWTIGNDLGRLSAVDTGTSMLQLLFFPTNILDILRC